MRKVWIAIVLSMFALAVTPVLAAEFVGTNGPDVLSGSELDDTIHGFNGADVLDGLSGDDSLFGGNGPDTLYGFDGFDVLDGDSGPDTLHGGAGGDQLQPDTSHDVVYGDAGSDLMLRGSSVVTGSGGDGNDVLLGGELSATLNGEAGDDLIVATDHSGIATVTGGVGDEDICYVQLLDVATCETVIRLSSPAPAPTLAITNGPADLATVEAGSVTLTFATSGAAAVYCVPDSGARERCDDGTFTVNGLDAGTHAVTIVAIGTGNTPAKAIMRRFKVVSSAHPSISSFDSPAADTLRVSGSNLANVDELRLRTGDGQQLTYVLPDERVVFDGSTAPETYTITDLNIGREVINLVEAIDAGQGVASKSGSVAIESSITLTDAGSPSASTLVIDGTNLTAVDRIVLTLDSGTLTISTTDAGVFVSDGQIIITQAALDGAHVSQIDAIRVFDGAETMATLEVDITISQSDSTPPAIQTPGDLTREAAGPAGAQVAFDVSAIDALDGPVGVSCDPASGFTFTIGETTVTCHAQDSAGNLAEESFVVSVTDTTGPAITIPESVVVDSTDPNGTPVEYATSATDLVDGDTAVVCAPESDSVFTIGVSNVLCESTDAHGNTSAETFTITVRDVVAPVLELVSEPVAFILDEQGEPVVFDVRAVDAVDGALEAICDPVSGSVFQSGEHPVHCTATDAHGNEGVLDFTLTVDLVDQTAPVIETPGDLVREAVSGEGAPVDFVVSAIDDVDGAVGVSCSPVSGSTFALGSTIVLCAATDEAGNPAHEIFLVTVIDSTAPALIVPEPITADADESVGKSIVYEATASDLVDGPVDALCTPISRASPPDTHHTEPH